MIAMLFENMENRWKQNVILWLSYVNQHNTLKHFVTLSYGTKVPLIFHLKYNIFTQAMFKITEWGYVWICESQK